MSYNVLLSDAVSDYLKSQDRGRQKAILKHLYEMRNDPFKGNVIRLKPTLHRLYRKRIGNDRVLFSIRGEDVYLELMGDRSYVYELAKRLERNIGGNDAPITQIVHRLEHRLALVRAGSRMGARARVGLPPGGGGRPVGPVVRGVYLWDGQLWRAGFLEVAAICYY